MHSSKTLLNTVETDSLIRLFASLRYNTAFVNCLLLVFVTTKDLHRFRQIRLVEEESSLVEAGHHSRSLVQEEHGSHPGLFVDSGSTRNLPD